MVRARLLVWLVALLAMAVPPLSAGAAQAAQPPAQPHEAAVHCPDHASPPNPCPDHDTARHAAGTCCPLMSGSLALMPAVDIALLRARAFERLATTVAALSSLSLVKDPPPPRS